MIMKHWGPDRPFPNLPTIDRFSMPELRAFSANLGVVAGLAQFATGVTIMRARPKRLTAIFANAWLPNWSSVDNAELAGLWTNSLLDSICKLITPIYRRKGHEQSAVTAIDTGLYSTDTKRTLNQQLLHGVRPNKMVASPQGLWHNGLVFSLFCGARQKRLSWLAV